MSTYGHIRRPFMKMHGLGNDFIVFDARKHPLALTGSQVRALSDRQKGIGCDQLIVIRPSDQADALMEIHNADGAEVGACGNATRCIGRLLMEETGADAVRIETRAGILNVSQSGAGIRVDMGRPGLDWQDIPLASAMDTATLELSDGNLSRPTALSMGNPHLIFFVDEQTVYDAAGQGARLEHHALFPQGVNVSFVRVVAPDHLVVRTWERGAGLTLACGTAACASLVGAHRRGLSDRLARVDMPGGVLEIAWIENDHVYMTGPATFVFEGRVTLPPEGVAS